MVLSLCTISSGVSPQIQHSSNDRCPSVRQMYFYVLIPCFIDHLGFVSDSVRFHAGIFSSFSHSVSTAAFAAGISIA